MWFVAVYMLKTDPHLKSMPTKTHVKVYNENIEAKTENVNKSEIYVFSQAHKRN